MNDQKLITKHLSKSYGKKKVLSDLDLTLNAGDLVGLVAPNGSGKTTLLRCLALLMKIDQGTIEICGIDGEKMPDQALQKLSALIDGPGLFETMTGKENIELFGTLMNVDRQRIEEMKEYTKLGNNLKKKVSTYSLGMKQRLTLSIALMKEPEILLLDEPINGLDPGGIIDLRHQLDQLRKNGTAMIVSSHQLNELEKLVNRVWFLVDQKLVEGTMNDLEAEYQKYFGHA